MDRTPRLLKITTAKAHSSASTDPQNKNDNSGQKTALCGYHRKSKRYRQENNNSNALGQYLKYAQYSVFPHFITSLSFFTLWVQ